MINVYPLYLHGIKDKDVLRYMSINVGSACVWGIF